jgi:hypothetical protein
VSSFLPSSLPPSLTSDLPTGVMLIAEEVTIRCRFSPGCPSSLPLSLYISALHFPRTPSLLIITQKYLMSDGLCLSLLGKMSTMVLASRIHTGTPTKGSKKNQDVLFLLKHTRGSQHLYVTSAVVNGSSKSSLFDASDQMSHVTEIDRIKGY